MVGTQPVFPTKGLGDNTVSEYSKGMYICELLCMVIDNVQRALTCMREQDYQESCMYERLCSKSYPF